MTESAQQKTTGVETSSITGKTTDMTTPTKQSTSKQIPLTPRKVTVKVPPIAKGVHGGKVCSSGGKRFHEQFVSKRNDITKPAMRRLARRSGVRRIAEPVYKTAREIINKFLKDILRQSYAVTIGAKRKTLQFDDVVHVIKNVDKTTYT